METDKNATILLANYYSLADSITYLKKFDLDRIKDFFVCWRGGLTVSEYAAKNLLQEHEGDKKEKYIEFAKDFALKNEHTDTTIFVVASSPTAQWMVFDGIHRAIGIQRAITADPSIKEKINLRILLLVGEKVSEDDNYKLSVK